MQTPHSVQAKGFTLAFPLLTVIAFDGQTSTQISHPSHNSSITNGFSGVVMT